MSCGQMPLGGCGNPDMGHDGPCTPYTEAVKMIESPKIYGRPENLTDLEWFSLKESRMWTYIDVDEGTVDIITEPDTMYISYYIAHYVSGKLLADHIVKSHNAWLIEQMSKD